GSHVQSRPVSYSQRPVKIKDRLAEMRAKAALGGGQQRIAQQHAKGKLTARERIDLVLDEGSFTELDAFVLARPTELIPDDERVMGDGVVTGFGRIGGRVVYMFVTGPNVVKTVTHEDVTLDELGGADVHAHRSGVAHFEADDEVSCAALLRRLVGFLPSNNLDPAPIVATEDAPDREDAALDGIVPTAS